MIEFFLALFGVLFGAGSMEVRRFERAAENDIRAKLQGEPKVNVQAKLNGIVDGVLGDMKEVTIRASNFTTQGLPLFTEPERSKKGRVKLLKIELTDFRLGLLRIESLSAQIPECRYDYSLAVRKRQIRLSKSGIGTGSVKIAQVDLQEYILKRFKEIKSVEVKIERDKVFVKGYGEFLLLATNFEVIARLGTPDGYNLYLTEPRIFFDGQRASDSAAQAVLKTLNPVIRLNDDLQLHGAIKVEGIRLQNGFLEAWGQTQIPILPKPEPSGDKLEALWPWTPFRFDALTTFTTL
jgi:hypothetical protein